MDLATILLISSTYAASLVAQQCAEEAVEAAWLQVKKLFSARTTQEPQPDDLSRQAVMEVLAGSPVAPILSAVYADSPALRRAAQVAVVFKGASILWCDDQPRRIEWESALLRALGANITVVHSNEAAVEQTHHARFDLILSDIDRNGEPLGLELPSLLGADSAPIVFYIGVHDRTRGVPMGAFGITSRPDELVHLVCDVLERGKL